MRIFRIALALCLALCAAVPAALAADKNADPPAAADVREYIRLFGYQKALEDGAERQLASLIELARVTQADAPPGALDAIHEELKKELRAESEGALQEMVAVFQKHLTRADVAYLVGVGRDPRMQRVIALQPALSEDMEGIGERLADTVTAKAAPRIEERLRQLRGSQAL